MGLVYLAHDRRTGLPVAIKVMSRWAADPDLQARFRKENRILSGLNHRNIVRCYEITESREGVPSIVMEFVDGVDFRAFEGRPYPELLPLMIQSLMGLTYLRGQNVLHRDLSSSNIAVTLENQSRVTKILDFGVAKVLLEQAVEGDVKTRTGQFLGKFAFASPEHFRGVRVDWRSDVYSLGVIFHRLLTGRPPITVARRSNYYDWMVAHERPRAFEVAAAAGAPALPEALGNVVERMLAWDPDERPQSYQEIIHSLDRVQRAVPPELEPDPRVLRTLPPPVEGPIGSSGSAPSPVTAPRRPVEPEPEPESAGVGSTQQKRWPDLDTRESHTERFAPLGARAAEQTSGGVWRTPGREPAPEPAPEPEQRAEASDASFSGSNPAQTELLPPPAAPDLSSTATTVTGFPGDGPSVPPMWTGGAAKDAESAPPAPLESPSPGPLEEKTERLDDVIEKLRQRPLMEPLAPAAMRTDPVATPAPPPPAARRPEPPQPPAKPPARMPASAPGRRLVVYGEAPVNVAPARAPAPPERPPAPSAGDGRLRSMGIALLVVAIVVLFAAVLWVLVAALKNPRKSGGLNPAHGASAVTLASSIP
jgi:serine/threonine protein kinase